MKIIFMDSSHALLAWDEDDDLFIFLCKSGSIERRDLQDLEARFENGAMYGHQWWHASPFSVLQHASPHSGPGMAWHDLGAIEDGEADIFSQVISYDMGVILLWEMSVSRSGDSLTIEAGLRLDDFESEPERVQAHFPEGRDGPPLVVTLPREPFLKAYNHAQSFLIEGPYEETED